MKNVKSFTDTIVDENDCALNEFKCMTKKKSIL